jgi:hypothetical protein
MEREDAKAIGELLKQFVSQNGISDELNRIQIFQAWDRAVGITAAQATVSKYLKDGILFCTISSSALRSQLYFQLDIIVKRINSEFPSVQIRKIVLK